MHLNVKMSKHFNSGRMFLTGFFHLWESVLYDAFLTKNILLSVFEMFFKIKENEKSDVWFKNLVMYRRTGGKTDRVEVTKSFFFFVFFFSNISITYVVQCYTTGGMSNKCL